MTNVVPASTYLSQFETQTDNAYPWRPFGIAKACVKDDDTRIHEAFRRGLAEGRSIALLESEAQHTSERRAADEAHARARASWVEAEGQRLSQQLVDSMTLIADRISSLAAAVIEPFVEEQLMQKAKGDLRRMLLDLLADGSTCTVSVRGPQDFCDYLKSILPDTATVNFETGSSEAIVTVGETVIESRIAEWVSDLKKACNE